MVSIEENYNSPEKNAERSFEDLSKSITDSANILHDKYREDFIKNKLGGEAPDPRLISPARYTYDNCAKMNWDDGKSLVTMDMQPDEIIPVQATFRPPVQRLGLIGQHYALIAKKGDKYYGVDFAKSQFGKLDTESTEIDAKIDNNNKRLFFETSSLEDALQIYNDLYDGKFEVTTEEESHRFESSH